MDLPSFFLFVRILLVFFRKRDPFFGQCRCVPLINPLFKPEIPPEAAFAAGHCRSKSL